MQTQSKFKIDFNKDLKVRHLITTCEGNEIKEEKVFESVTCFLNFHEDVLKFAFKVENFRWRCLSVTKKSIFIERTDSLTYQKCIRELPIDSDESTRESSFTIVNLLANVKNVPLNLFSPHTKVFKLIIDYSNDSIEYQTTFNVVVPTVEQEDWYAGKAGIFKTQVYEAKQTGGIDLIKLFHNNFKLNYDSKQSESTLLNQLQQYVDATTADKFKNFDFLDMFKKMMVLRDLSSIKAMKDFSLTFQKVFHYHTCRYTLRNEIEQHLKYLMCPRKMKYFLQRTFVIEVTKKMPYDAQEFDYIFITDMLDYQNYHDDLHEIAEHRVMGKIAYIFGNVILFQLTYKSRREAKLKHGRTIDEERSYHIEFQPNRISTRVAHQAIDVAKSKQLTNYLKDFTGQQKTDQRTWEDFEWMNSSIEDNEEQQVAIKNIVNCTSYPSPYVVFGPPGTGKTSTIIEAIAQIVNLKENVHILVTASSNAACDDIGNRLLKHVSMNKVLRLYSPAFDKKPEKIDKVLEQISNFRNRRLCACKKRSCPEIEPCDDPSYEEFYTARVIIATLVSCGRIYSAGIKSNHFDYIFIDEAASECEPITLIPIACLGTGTRGVNAQIVLSGDHKQLGAIVQERFCRKMGMEKSMMERIIETNRNYKLRRNFNSKFVTQLVKNYRSHQAILQFSNENFYESKLVFMCPPVIANFACGWDFLFGNKDFPLIFHTSRTPSQEVALSLKNEGEVNLLDQYIRTITKYGIKGQKVHQTDIGIISPYRAQRDRIFEQFHDKFPKIEIGTVDAFQGREKKIILMSTVRSRTKHVGFLRNEKRLNVSLTRAKSLLIIIGNSATLQKSLIWNKFISYCYNNRAIVGDVLAFDKKLVADPNYQGNEKIPKEVDEDEYDE